ncbi:DNA replication complex GINS protein SLD5 [Suhomyces tanzawaensis NRRL Y-17324]|uniref:DNA replication complex GINS protein SLD5 n=1 Tax=Suhomyces tanzawaensis NRRL Y-17324 TaxID=984487 RepID=A0A1E4SJF2_9ASCO|nr:DNA replication complex GINS protein SLD5 [Suhomyces tanzawaensis NRRL Y-17324]ODV79567.1 DNA replication complex GINS protein SLD5 [Suhomyces tanzawaensis NRRL Y-17324]
MDIDDILQEFETATSRKETKKTPTTLYDELVVAMVNERMAPELLPFKHELLQKVLAQISNQQQFLLDSHEYGDVNAESGVVTGDFKLQLMIIETDIERINYLIRLYLRTRLSKIDKFTIFYINETADEDPDSKDRLLSSQEQKYMHQHFKILTRLYNNCFLKRLPHTLTLLDDTSGGQSMIVEPDLNQPVFVKSITDKPITISLGEDDELDLVNDGIYVVKYKLVRDYISIGDVVMI